MTAVYRTPGVSYETFDRTPDLIGLLRTDIAGFVGIAERGPLDRAVKVESWNQFVTAFGGWVSGGHLAYAVDGFFANGGATAWVVRAADRKAARAAQVRVTDDDGRLRLVVRASTPGRWGNDLRVTPVRRNDRIVRLLVSLGGGGTTEVIPGPFPPAPAQPPHRREYQNLLGVPSAQLPNSGMPVLAEVECLEPEYFAGRAPSWRSDRWRLSGGEDGVTTMTLDDLTGRPDDTTPRGLELLKKVDQVGIVAIPDLSAHPYVVLPSVLRPADRCTVDCRPGAPLPDEPSRDDALIREPEYPPGFDLAEGQVRLITHCEQLRDRFAILDIPGGATPEAATGWQRENLPASNFTALYYPWIRITDPLGPPGSVRLVPPSGHMAGVFARCDRSRGVHKPPANERIEGVHDTAFPIDDAIHGDLNDAQVNAIRAVPGRGVLVLGTRTLDRDIRFRYINVRRLLSMIEESIDQAMQWTVFEPHDRALRHQIDRGVREFLERLFVRGMLDGATSEAAYTVTCDASNNTAEDVDAGRVICTVGLQPPYPAEFVVVKIGFTRAGVAVEERGAQDV